MNQELRERAERVYRKAHGMVEEARERYLREDREAQKVSAIVRIWLERGAPAAMVDLSPGERIGRYEIQSEVGAGGMGRVYRATDTTLHRVVALKTLREGATAESRARRRFLREAETVSALNHPNIVTVYETGAERGIDYIAMEFVQGQSLGQRIANRGLALGPLYEWAIQIADALAAAHQAGIVHRDLKPGNVMINERGAAKVLDFGLATAPVGLLTEGGETQETLTTEGTILGTHAYMAPEQAEGRTVDSRADIFAFGCVLYEMVTGRRAFEGDSGLATISALLQREPVPAQELAGHIPESLDRILRGCLKKKVGERWQSVGDVRILLEESRRDWEAAKQAHHETWVRTWWKWPLVAAVGGLMTWGALWSWKRAVAIPPEPVITALTTDGGLSDSPSLAKDGSLLAFASDRAGEGNMDIWIQQVGGGALIRLTRDAADEVDPDISPDGTRVVFRSEKDTGGIYTVAALGGEPVLVATGGRNPRFSPDGKWIAYWTGRDGTRLIGGEIRTWVVASGGGEPAPAGGGLAAAAYPAWSPSGEKLLVVGRREQDVRKELEVDWWVVPTRETGAVVTGALREIYRRASPPPGQYHVIPTRWTPGGVLFAARYGDPVHLWSMQVNERNGRSDLRMTRLTSGTNSETSAAVAAAGRGQRIAFASHALNFDVWGIPVDAERGKRTGEMVRMSEDRSSDYYPTATRDGSRISFLARRDAGDYLSVKEPKTGRQTVLLTQSDPVVSPRISGNGQWVMFSTKQNDVRRVSTRGGEVTTLCTKCGTPTDVSRDGRRVLLEAIASPEDVNVLDTADGKVTTMVPADGSLYDAVLSPDEKWVAFQRIPAGQTNSGIYVARLEGGKAVDKSQWVVVAEPTAANRVPAWSPEGNALYWISDSDGFRCVWARRWETVTGKPLGAAEAVNHFHHIRRSLQRHRGVDSRVGLAVTTGMVLMSLGDLTGNIYMMERTPR